MSTTNDIPKPQAARLPSLNQLAARININAATPASSSSTSAPRPRLAAFAALRTGSTTSLASATTNDSTRVNAPSSRSSSPSTTLSSSPPQSATPNEDMVGSEPLTKEKLDKLNTQEGHAVSFTNNPPVKGYKNIPSLDAITARLAKARALSIDGTAKPPEAEMIEDPKTPGIPMKAPEHPLQFKWTIYHDSKTKYPNTPAHGSASVPGSASVDGSFPQPTESNDYEAGLTVVGEFSTVEEFCRYFNWLKPPSNLERNSNYHLFKSGIKPMWEDEANANGGKWVLTMKNNPQLLDRCWNWLAMALVGEEVEDGDDITGAVVSLRSKVDRIQIWTRSKDDVERLNAIGKKLVKLLDISEADAVGLEFQYNSDDRPLPNKFLSIQAMPNTGFRPSFQQSGGGASPSSDVHMAPTAAPNSGGAFGSFGIGLGGAGWRAKRP